MGSSGGCCVSNHPIRNIIDGIKRGLKNIFGGGSRGSSNAGRTESYDSTVADLEATVKVQNALTMFREDTRTRSEDFENDVIRESREALDEFICELKKYNKIRYGNNRLNLNIGSIERENRKTEDKIHGFIVKRVSKRISLDDTECLEILKLNAGADKEKKMDAFYQKVLKEAVGELTDILKEAMEKQTETVEDSIQTRIDSIVSTVEIKAIEFKEIQNAKDKDEAAMEKEQVRLSHLISLCDYGLSFID